MKRSGSSSDRDRRLGIKARGSMDFLLLCMKRGVPPEKISGFLLGLGLDAQTVNRWMDYLKREMAGIPGRTPMGSERPQPVDPPGRMPAGTSPMTLEGKTATDFVLPDLDATKGHAEAVENLVIAEEEIDVSLEISDKDVRKGVREDSQDYERDRVTINAPNSILVSSPPESLDWIPDAPRVQLEKQSKKKKRRSSRRDGDRKFLATPQARLAAFAAVILLTWLFSDAGWFPGGSARQATMPSSDLVAREEPPRAKPEEAPAPQAQAPQPPAPGPEEGAQEAAVSDYPDPWATTPAVRTDAGRVPGSSKSPIRRPKNSKKSRISVQIR